MVVSPVLLTLLALLLTTAGALVGVAVRWGAHAQGAARMDKDLADLRSEVRELASRLRALEVSSVQQAALAQEIAHLRSQSTERHEQVMGRLDRMETHILAGARAP
jgi:hypothetical protein